jgi:hypothetical protein
MQAEYIKGEFFFDLNTETERIFDKVMNADSLALSFAKKGDQIEFQFLEEIGRGLLVHLLHIIAKPAVTMAG